MKQRSVLFYGQKGHPGGPGLAQGLLACDFGFNGTAVHVHSSSQACTSLALGLKGNGADIRTHRGAPWESSGANSINFRVQQQANAFGALTTRLDRE